MRLEPYAYVSRETPQPAIASPPQCPFIRLPVNRRCLLRPSCRQSPGELQNPLRAPRRTGGRFLVSHDRAGCQVHLETAVGGLDDVDREFPWAMEQITAAANTMRYCSATIVVGLIVHPPVLHPVEIGFDLGTILLPTIRLVFPTLLRNDNAGVVPFRVRNMRGELTGAVCNWNSGLGGALTLFAPLKNGMCTRSCEAIADPFGAESG